MVRWTRWLVVAAVAVCPGLPGSAWAVYPPPIKDDGKFFGKEAVEKANKKIRELYDKYKKDVIVETLSQLSTDQEKKLKEEGRDKFFNRFAFERGKELGLNGVYIVISKNPQYLRVHMDAGTQKRAFLARDRDRVAKAVIAEFKEDRFDAGLLAALNAIDQALAANSK